MSMAQLASGTSNPRAGEKGEDRIEDSGTDFKLFNISLEINRSQAITSDKNEPCCEGIVVPAGRVSGTINKLTDCQFEPCLTLEAENGGVVLASHPLGRRANTIDFLRPLMNEDMLLFACVVRFPDTSL
jgi:hypothetical protein